VTGRVVILALAFTLLNAFKPVTIDDPVYFAFARQVVADPTDPYGSTVFWYEDFEPALTILAPAVYLYYLAGVMGLVGTEVVAVKLCLFPWAWLFVFALDRLLARFGAHHRTAYLTATVLSPAFLPGFNLMLDVPALALGLATVALFLRAQERGSVGGAVVAGVVLGLAMQTKYTTFVIPMVIAWAVLLRGRWPLGVLTVATGVALFVSWEGYLVARYGASHFALSAGGQGGLLGLVERAVGIVPFFLSYLGGLGCIWLLIGLWVLPAPRWLVATAATVVLAAFLIVALLDSRLTNDTRPSPMLFGETKALREVIQPVEPLFVGLGAALVAVLGVAAIRQWHASDDRRTVLFLAGWLLLELAGSLALSPFPAGRRLFGFLAVMPLLLGRFAAGGRGVLYGLVGLQVALGLGFAALDWHGAWAHQTAARRAAAWVAAQDGPRGTVWYVGHWGFQFYADEAGMRQLRSDFAEVPDRVEPGDWIVLPDPRLEQQRLRLPADAVELRHAFAIPAAVPVRTVACYHGGRVPVEHFEGHALEVRIYRATKPFVAPFVAEPERFHAGY